MKKNMRCCKQVYGKPEIPSMKRKMGTQIAHVQFHKKSASILG